MKYLIIGLILLLSGIIVWVWQVNETMLEAPKYAYHIRPIGVKKLVAPYFITLGLIFTFVGIVSVSIGKTKKKRNFYKK